MQIDFLAYFDRTRYGIDRGRTAENRPFEALINDSPVLDVVVGKPAAEAYRQHDKNREGDSDDRIARYKSINAPRALLSLRNFDLDGHDELAESTKS